MGVLDGINFQGVQPAVRDALALLDGASIDAVALSDFSGGTVAANIAAGVGVYDLTIPVPDLTVFTTAAADLATGIVLGHKFKVLSWEFITTKAGTGTSASLVFNMEVGTTDIGTVPSTCTVTLTGTNTLGKRTAGTTVTGANTGTATDALSVELAASGTVFTAGSGFFAIKVQNMDSADAIATLVDALAG